MSVDENMVVAHTRQNEVALCTDCLMTRIGCDVSTDGMPPGKGREDR